MLTFYRSIKSHALLYVIAYTLLTLPVAGCKKLVEVDPPITKVSSEVVFTTNETAVAAVTGIYAQMANSFPLDRGFHITSTILGITADELSITVPQGDLPMQAYFTNRLTVTPGVSPMDFWETIYSPLLAQVNTAIEELEKAATFEENSEKSSLNADVKKQLLGEAYFLRGFFYFYLVQLYGDVPLLLTSDYLVNSTAGRTPKDQVYEQIIKDLKLAEDKLNAAYVHVITTRPVANKIRPVKAVASALLARVYLYKGDYALAEQYALSVINNPLYAMVALEDIGKVNNKEAIWQLQPVAAGRNTQDAWVFILTPEGPTEPSGQHPVFLNPLLMGAFEPGDKRKDSWVRSVTVAGVTYNYPFKYQSATLGAAVTEHTVMFRLAEQYLICAEARAKLNRPADGDLMLNVIRKRAGLPDIHSANGDELFKTVMHERQVELFTEWGHRWLDIKRTGMVDEVMGKATPLKGGNAWRSYQQWFPIPAKEFLLNSALAGQQNPGY